MEKTTIYIHREKDEEGILCECGEHRVVTFVSGSRDITEILKDLIKTQYQP
jgi:hypothetical protein